MDLDLPSGEPILRCHITDGAVQSYRVVVIHIELNQAARIFHRQRGQWPDALLFERLMPAFDFPIGVSCQLRHNVTSKDNDSVSFILIIPGTDANLNC